MNIDRSKSDFQRVQATGPVVEGSGWWTGFKDWSGRHPRLSRIFWFIVGLALLALLIWASYPP